MISFFTDPRFPRIALGIERESITAVELVREAGRFTVQRAATIELPPGLVRPSFTEKNISDHAQFRHFLNEALTVSGLLDQKAWSVSLPGNTARCAILSFEKSALEKGSYDEIIDWKAEQSFGAPAPELRIQREKIATEEGRVRFFATAVKLSVLDEYESSFESLGIKAGMIIPRALSELKWLYAGNAFVDSLLISSQDDGFTALLLHDGEPAVVRSVTCTPSEQDDEIFRLLMFYRDRFAEGEGEFRLGRMMSVGRTFVPAKLREISAEALGSPVDVLSAEDVGLSMPQGGFDFHDLAAPAGLATFGFR
ncbi:MAG TPA: hypothetical protein PKD24_06760 [Pyrinomonadaceae bacterium]|nr:hypothetical protein [Pyrinomonadaceae bacterium]HMP65142.1 hypothetical protein [Pyrinomonadaceae bacterium]